MSLGTIAAAMLASLIALPAAAQISSDPLPPPESADHIADPSQSPRAAPSSGMAGSLGGSGATGPDSVGTLPQRDTDFDRKTWRDTPFPLVLRLLDALPDRFNSAAAHELAKNLLVSVADAPPDDDGDSKMLLRRVQKLLAIGNMEDAAALARAAPGVPSEEALAHAEVEAELLANQIEAACIDLRAFAPAFSEPWTRDGLMLCRARAGEKIEGDIPALDTGALGPLGRILGAPVPADPANSPPAHLAAAARDPKLAPEQRLEAAFAAGRASAIPGATLAGILQAAASHADIEADSGPPTTGAAAAALFHAIGHAGDANQKIALAERGLLSPVGISDKVGVAMLGPLRDLQPSPELQPLATRLAIMFYSLGDVEAATPWAEMATQSGMGASLWPYRVLLKQADAVGIADWEQQASLDPARIARILEILSAFDITAPPGGSTQVAGEDLPDAPLPELLAMDKSAKELRVGETVLRALAILGPDGPARAHPLTLRRVLTDLDHVQMHDEARAFAFEAVTATLLGH